MISRASLSPVRATALALALAAAAATPLWAAHAIVVRTPAGIDFIEAEAVTINAKDQVRLSSGPPESATAGAALKLANTSSVLWVLQTKAPAQLDESGKITYLFPEGIPRKGVLQLADSWSDAEIAYKKSRQEKTGTPVELKSFLALLPSGPEAVAELAMSGQAHELLAGKDGAFQMQIAILSAAVRKYGQTEAMQDVRQYLLNKMSGNFRRFESGAGQISDLKEGLTLAELSDKAYPQDAAQKEIRDGLRTRQAWLDRRIAALRALAAGTQWDAFLTGYRDFEKYQWSFPDLMEAHNKALAQSLAAHRKSGEARMQKHDFRYAHAEFKKALARKPSDAGLRDELTAAWTEYSLEVARKSQGNQKKLAVSQRDAIKRQLQFADNALRDKRNDEALTSVLTAERIDKDDLNVMLKKAEVLGAQNNLVAAIATLNECDLRALDEDRAKVSQLRNDLLYLLNGIKSRDKKEIQTLLANSFFHKAHRVALDSLKTDNEDPDFLYFAGVSSLLVRKRDDGKNYLRRYLETSNTLDADAERRKAVYQLLERIQTDLPEEKGRPNWLSGRALAAGTFYCPISLAFQPRVSGIKANKKFSERFTWAGDKLKSIEPQFENNAQQTSEKPFYFAYDPAMPYVQRVAHKEIEEKRAKDDKGPSIFLRADPKADKKDDFDPDKALEGLNVLYGNNPYIDPAMVKLLTGRDLAIGVAGNKYFNPFVWERAYFFQFSYDEQGRVRTAKQRTDMSIDDGGRGGDAVTLEFVWDGYHLMSITAYGSAGYEAGNKSQVYERRLNYSGNKLMGETIRHGSKKAKIDYKYSGDSIATASLDDDDSADSRSRVVSFVN